MKTMPLLWKLLTLIAVLMMPLGMAAASAHPQGDRAMAGMTMNHCPDQDGQHDMAGGFSDCAMACASALPAAELHNDLPWPIAAIPDRPSLAARLYGLLPEPAKPPPRSS